MGSKVYRVTIKQQGQDGIDDFFTRKTDVIRFIAKEMSVSQKSIRNEVQSQTNSTIYRDNLGWRAEIYFEVYS